MPKHIDLLLVNPGNRVSAYGGLAESFAGIEPPLWCGLIAAFIREQGYSVDILDADAENLSPQDTAQSIARRNPLLAGIIIMGTNPSASSTPKMGAVNELLKALKKVSPHIKTVLGGLHPSAIPEKTVREEEADFVCQGEGFYTYLKLLEALKAGQDPQDNNIDGLWFLKEGRVISNPPAPVIDNLDKLPFVAWDLLPMNRYRAHNWHCFDDLGQRNPYAVIYTSLGCPFSCHYCPVHALYGKRGIRFRSPENVIKEIDLLVEEYKVKNIKVMDELFVLKEECLMDICDLIIQRGYKLNIWVYARVDTVKGQILRKMKRAGINWICLGIESANQYVRGAVSKNITKDQIENAIREAQAVGIYVMGNFIFGLPDDDFKTMEETLDMAKRLRFEYVNFYVAMPYPGSKLYNDAVRDGLPLPRNWDGYGQYSQETLPLPTTYLSAAEVLRFRDYAFHEYFSTPEYLSMIREKFGIDVVRHIEEMLKYKIKRKYAH